MSDAKYHSRITISRKEKEKEKEKKIRRRNWCRWL